MGRNTKPMLTVLMDGDRLQALREYAAKSEVSMGWLVNRMVERVLSGEFDVLGDSTRGTIETSSTGITRDAVEELVRESIEKHLEGMGRESIETVIDKSSTGIDRATIEEMIKTSIGTPLTREDIEGMVRESIGAAIEPIENGLNELETYTKNQLEAVRDELKKPLAGVR